MAQKQQYRVKGRTVPGVFSNERVFITDGADGRTIEVMVPIEDIQEHDGQPTVRGVVEAKDGDYWNVFIPGQPMETPMWVWVHQQDLIRA